HYLHNVHVGHPTAPPRSILQSAAPTCPTTRHPLKTTRHRTRGRGPPPQATTLRPKGRNRLPPARSQERPLTSPPTTPTTRTATRTTQPAPPGSFPLARR